MQSRVNKVRALLAEHSAAGILVETQANFHWLTDGRSFIGLNSESACAALLITSDHAYLLSNNIESKRLLSEEMQGNFELLEYPWYEEKKKAELIASACNRGRCLKDSELAGQFMALRTVLDDQQQKTYRTIAPQITRILEQQVRGLKQGVSELEVAGALSDALWQINVEPVTLLIGFDERLSQWRHLLPTAKKLRQRAIASLAVRYRGLFVSVTREACFGTVPADIVKRHEAVCRVNSAVMAATQAGTSMEQVFNSLIIAYAATGYADEWQRHHQGGLTGYVSRESKAGPGNAVQLADNQAFAWNPTIAGVKSEETIMLHTGRAEILTATGEWNCKEYDGFVQAEILQL